MVRVKAMVKVNARFRANVRVMVRHLQPYDRMCQSTERRGEEVCVRARIGE